MNTSARIEFLLNPANNNAAVSAKAPNPAEKKGLEFKQQFEKQLQTPAKQAESSTTKPNQTAEANKEKVTHAVDRNRRSDPSQLPATKEKDVKDIGGESLPLTEEARNFIAALPLEEQEQLLEEVRQWLTGLTPQELKELKLQLTENPEQLLADLPKALQDLLANLDLLDLDKQQIAQGFTDVLASLVNSDIDFQQLAAIQLHASAAGELKLVLDTTAQRAEPLTASVRETEVKPLVLGEGKSDNKQQSKEQATANQDKLNELVSSLGKASAQSVTRAGGEAINQLLQAAGMGLTATQAAGPATQTVARLAAGFSSMPFMMQAAADSNAQALANRISLMNAKNMQVAEMRLDPPNLGSVRIQIRMQGDQASIIFQAPNAHARELLEQSLPKLREMMESEGLMLADAQVSEESFSGQGKEQDSSPQYAGSSSADNEDDVEGMQIPLLTQPLGLIDYYA